MPAAELPMVVEQIVSTLKTNDNNKNAILNWKIWMPFIDENLPIRIRITLPNYGDRRREARGVYAGALMGLVGN